MYQIINPDLKTLRKIKDYSAEEVARRCGVSPQTIYSLEKYKTQISIPMLKMLAEIYGIAPEDIFLPYKVDIVSKEEDFEKVQNQLEKTPIQ